MEFVDEIIETGGPILGTEHMETLRVCMQCGKCTGGCPSGRLTAIRTRKLVLEALLNMRDEVLSSDELWLCTTCYTCYERCPRNVKVTDITRTIRNIAAKEGYLALSHRMASSYVVKTGHAVPINDANKENRKKLGLPELPPTTHTYKEALQGIQSLVKKTGFDELIGFDWETMNLKE
ncbi:MAG: CoB--CoM heterodisulfide reductase subunit C [Methanosarcinales archaeon]